MLLSVMTEFHEVTRRNLGWKQKWAHPSSIQNSLFRFRLYEFPKYEMFKANDVKALHRIMLKFFCIQVFGLKNN